MKNTKTEEIYFVEEVKKPMILEQGTEFLQTLYTMYAQDEQMKTISRKVFAYSKVVSKIDNKTRHDIYQTSESSDHTLEAFEKLKEGLPPLYKVVIPRILPKKMSNNLPLPRVTSMSDSSPPWSVPKEEVSKTDTEAESMEEVMKRINELTEKSS